MFKNLRCYTSNLRLVLSMWFFTEHKLERTLPNVTSFAARMEVDSRVNGSRGTSISNKGSCLSLSDQEHYIGYTNSCKVLRNEWQTPSHSKRLL